MSMEEKSPWLSELREEIGGPFMEVFAKVGWEPFTFTGYTRIGYTKRVVLKKILPNHFHTRFKCWRI
jgi:hypothetical protein